MCKLLERMLHGLGYPRVSLQENGRGALAMFNLPDGVPDIILLDINMPGMDGVEFVRHLSELHYSGGLVLVSGEDDLMLRATEKLAHAHCLAVLGFLHKPATLNGLSSMLEKWIPRAAARLLVPGKIYDADTLAAAIANGQLTNYYQPKVAVATGKLIGVEALVRWQHPVDGLVLPDQFISVAEGCGLINDLTRVVLREALKQVKAWQATGLMLCVAVNVSMDDLADLSFADFVAAETAAAGLSPHDVELEVTETRLMKNLTTALDVLTRLRLKHFRLSIDDFGTGHSSLVQLRDLPFDILKIDQSFTHRASQDSRLKAIFQASLDLANYLGMTVVAEGVEDADDWDFQRTIGSHVAQGYFIGKPMPADKLAAWLVDWQARMQTFTK
jgi:EAL domain-containing protein (putative c-di-GMP-specific phosphodiesterase class I)